MSKIKVIDSIMGSGKTSWAIRHMNATKDERFIFITPFIDEITRIIEACRERDFRTPGEFPSKQQNFMRLLWAGKNIAITHELFKAVELSASILEVIRTYGYTLILDEMLEVVLTVPESKQDIAMLFNEGIIEVDKATKIVKWNDAGYGGRFEELRRTIKTKTVIYYNDTLFLWLFPVGLLTAFDNLVIMTFLFQGSSMEQYLTINRLSYDMAFINQDGDLQNGEQDLTAAKMEIASLIRLYDGPLNRIGEKTAYSKSWWINKKNAQERKAAENNACSYIRNVVKARADDVIWSRYKNGKELKDKNIKPDLCKRFQNGFCACNARATNKFKDKTCLAYLVNVYVNPEIEGWFRDNGGKIDGNVYALSQLLQWVYRSAIRCGKHVNLYLPSKRMRDILKDWLAVVRG